MRNNTKIAFCGIMAALSVVCMLLSYFPYFTYAAPGVASLFVMISLIETDKKWATGVYIASALLILIFAENESRFIYLLFFGHYPILKAIFDGRFKGIILWTLKIVTFNLCVVAIYYITSALIGFSLEEFSVFGKYGVAIIVLLLNAVFVVYDIALSRMAFFYINRFHSLVKKMLKF